MQRFGLFFSIRHLVFGVVLGAVLCFAVLCLFRDSVFVYIAIALPVLVLSFYRLSIAIGILIGASWFFWSAVQQLEERWPDELDKTQHTIHVKLVELPKYGRERSPSRFVFSLVEPLTLEQHELSKGTLIRLSDYHHLPIKVDQVWQISAVLRSPRSFVNPAGFDYAKWLFSNKIAATGYIVSDDQNKIVKELDSASLLGFRDTVSIRLDKSLRDDAPLLKTLIMADKRSLEDHHHQVLQRLGLSHLFVISGLHVGMVAMALWWLGAILKRLCWWPTTSRQGLYFHAMFPFVGAIVYAALAGFSLPTLRAVVMVAIALLAFSWRRHYSAKYSLCLAAVVVISLQPLSIMTVSFWLSFLATASLLWLLVSQNKIRDFVLAQIVIFAVLSVVSGLFGLSTPIFAPLINLVAIPLMSLCLLPATLISALIAICGWSIPIQYVAELFELFWLLLLLVDSWQLPVLNLQPPLWQSFMAAIALAVTWYRFSVWPLAAICVGFTFIPFKESLDKVNVTVLDVGQGLSILIQTPERAIVYDTGARYPSGFSLAEAVIEPVLRKKGITRLDALIVSHADNDHAGGMDYLIERFDVSTVFVPSDMVSSKSGYVKCEQGREVFFDKQTTLQFITPSISEIHSDNDLSCVALLAVGDVSLLMPGDIELIGEMAVNRDVLNEVTAVVVPHHGSRTSSSDRFLDAMPLEWAFISAGFNNRFNHPHPDVVERYKARNIEVFNTAEDGALQLTIDGKTLRVEALRESKLGFWH